MTDRLPRTALFFDSGIGGLSVLREARVLMPDWHFVYVADDAAFPYGAWEEDALREHITGLFGVLFETYRPALSVIACNTASTLAVDHLRKVFPDETFVGTVPAIKPAAERTRSGLISVLATAGTIRRDYTRGLIAEFAGHCRVQLVGAAHLAPLAEAHMRGEAVDDAALLAEIAPAFVEQDGARTDMIVLACTHFPFLLDRFTQLAPWPVEWIDPAAAIARRVASVVPADAGSGAGQGGGRAWLTSGSVWPEALVPLLAGADLEPAVGRVAGSPAPKEAARPI